MAKIVGHTRAVVAGAIVLGSIMGGGLTVLLMARDSPLKACIITEMRTDTPGVMAKVLQRCAERHGILRPDRAS
jgi:hypothetical protein